MDDMNFQQEGELKLLKIDRDNGYSLLSQALRLLQDLSREMDHLQSSVENGVLRTSELEAELGSCGRALNDAHAFLRSQSSESGAGNGGTSSGVSFVVADALKEANDRAIRAETHLSEVANDFKKALERASEAAADMESRYEAKVRQCEEEVVDLTCQCTSLREEVNSVRSLNESLHTDLNKDREERDTNQSFIKIELETALHAAEERSSAASAALETQRIEFEEKFSQLLSAAASTEAMRMSERDNLEGLLSSSEGSLLATEAKLRERDVQLEHAREALDIATEQLSALRESSRRQLEVMRSECEKEIHEVIKSKQAAVDEAIFNASNVQALLEDKIKSQSMQHAIALNDLKGQLKAQKEAEVELQQRAARAIAASAQVARAAQEEARSIKTSTSLAAEVRHLAASHREHVKSGAKSSSGVTGSVLISSKLSPQVTAKATTSKVKTPIDPVKPIVADLTSAPPSSVPPPNPPSPPPQPLVSAIVPIAAAVSKPSPVSISAPPAPVAASAASPIVSSVVSAPVTAAAPAATPSKSITPAVANVPPAPTVDTTAALSKPTSTAAIAKTVEPSATNAKAKGTTSLSGTALPTPINVVATDSSTSVAPKKLTWSEMQKLKAQKTTT
jgi:hypothetical protein